MSISLIVIFVIVIFIIKISIDSRKPKKSKRKSGAPKKNTKIGITGRIPTIEELSEGQKEYIKQWNNSPNKSRMHGLPGFSLQKTFGTKGAIGATGELHTAEILNSLCFQYPELQVYHGVHLNNYRWDIDHIITLGNSIIIVDTKAWKSGYTYSIQKEENGTLHFLRNGKEFMGGEVSLKGMTDVFRRSYPNYNLYPIVSLSNDKCLIVGDLEYEVGIVPLKGLRERITGILTNTYAYASPELDMHCLDIALVRDRI